jgi:hypothetical protein
MVEEIFEDSPKSWEGLDDYCDDLRQNAEKVSDRISDKSDKMLDKSDRMSDSSDEIEPED